MQRDRRRSEIEGAMRLKMTRGRRCRETKDATTKIERASSNEIAAPGHTHRNGRQHSCQCRDKPREGDSHSREGQLSFKHNRGEQHHMPRPGLRWKEVR